MRLIYSALFLLLYANLSFAQITISPSSIFIDPSTKNGKMTVKNMTDQPKELTVSFRYGYLSYDDSGNPYINFDDSTSEKLYSLRPYIKALPSKAILGPFEELQVNVLVKHPAGLDDGTYWTRIAICAKNTQSIIDDDDNHREANVQITTNMIGTVIYQKGLVSTSLLLDSVDYTLDSTSLNLWLGLNRNGGNSPYFGRVNIIIYDDNNNEIDRRTDSYCVVYFNCRQKVSFEIEKFKPGKYRAEMTFDTERSDIPKQFILTTEKIYKVFEFEIKS